MSERPVSWRASGLTWWPLAVAMLLLDQITKAIMTYTGERKYTVDSLAAKLLTRVKVLSLGTPRDEPALLLDIGAYLSSLVTNYLHTGKFKRSV